MSGACGSPPPKMRNSADSWQAEGAILERCCSASSAHGTARTEARRLGLLACLAISNFKSSIGVRAESLGSPISNMQNCADSWPPEEASLENCCSASSVHGTARTEAQTLGLLACLAPSNLKRRLGRPCRMPLSALLRKCERLQIAGRQKGLAWKAVG